MVVCSQKIDDNKWVVPAVLITALGAALEIIRLIFLTTRFIVHWVQGP
jgi:hypothetical protein